MLIRSHRYRELAAIAALAGINLVFVALVLQGMAAGVPSLVALPLLLPPGLALGALMRELVLATSVERVEPQVELPLEQRVLNDRGVAS